MYYSCLIFKVDFILVVDFGEVVFFVSCFKGCDLLFDFFCILKKYKKLINGFIFFDYFLNCKKKDKRERDLYIIGVKF